MFNKYHTITLGLSEINTIPLGLSFTLVTAVYWDPVMIQVYVSQPFTFEPDLTKR